MKSILFLSLLYMSHASAAPVFKLYDFWASWCGPCKESFPALDKLHAKYKIQIEFVGVNMDLDKRDMKIFLKKYPVGFSQIRDDNKILIKKYMIQGLPTILIVDDSGREVFRLKGYTGDDHKKIEKTLCRILKSQSADCIKK